MLGPVSGSGQLLHPKHMRPFQVGKAAVTILPISMIPEQADTLSFGACSMAAVSACTPNYYEEDREARPCRMERRSKEYSPQLLHAIRERATELYQRSGAIPGHDLENWCKAEAEIVHDQAAHLARRAIVVKLEGMLYTGEYEFASAGGYTPGEWKPGDPVRARLAGDKLYLLRPNGLVLQTTVVKRTG
jgi:hypothetical protein